MTSKMFLPLLAAVSLFIACGPELSPTSPEEEQPHASEADDVSSVDQGLRFNACACLDLSRISDCNSSGVCYRYCRGRYDDTYHCRRTDKTFKCPSWFRYQVGTRVPNICRG